MISFYKWLVGAMASVVIVFGSFYISSVEADTERAYQSVGQQSERLLEHEQRITTLEESKRNTEQILKEIKATMERIEDAVNRRTR